MGFFDYIEELLEKPLTHALKKAQGQEGEQSPMASLFTALISFIKQLFSKDGATPDFEDGPPPVTREQRHQFEVREQAERAAVPSFNDSVRHSFSPTSIVKVPRELLDMRNTAEGRRGGRHIEAIMPVAGDVRISSGFGDRERPMEVASKDHKGLDIAPQARGSHPDIVAPMPGVVVGAGWKEGYGNTVDIMDIYGTRHRFGHLEKFDVHVGQTVAQGDKIATMGMTGHATGVHLHYEQRDKNNKAIAPVLMALNWNEGNHITLAENTAFLQSQRQESGMFLTAAHKSKRVETQLAQLDLSSLHQTEDYAPPASSGVKGHISTDSPARGN